LADALRPDESRGDTSFEWEIGGQKLRGHGHLFAPAEVESLIHAAGLRVVSRVAVDYTTGERSNCWLFGQLAFMCEAASRRNEAR
jgi:hypothetical protein